MATKGKMKGKMRFRPITVTIPEEAIKQFTDRQLHWSRVPCEALAKELGGNIGMAGSGYFWKNVNANIGSRTPVNICFGFVGRDLFSVYNNLAGYGNNGYANGYVKKLVGREFKAYLLEEPFDLHGAKEINEINVLINEVHAQEAIDGSGLSKEKSEASKSSPGKGAVVTTGTRGYFDSDDNWNWWTITYTYS